jgi:hypothetical protein
MTLDPRGLTLSDPGRTHYEEAPGTLWLKPAR